ncbi:hypothetical protein BJX70DRAFT_403231 [Aspergillus crustosus]
MSQSDPLNLHIAFCKRPPDAEPGYPQHWLLILSPPNHKIGTYYHAVGVPGVGAPYTRAIEANKRLDNYAFSKIELICTIPAAHQERVRAACDAVQPVYCQSYVLDVLKILERHGVVPRGTVATYTPRMEKNPWAKKQAWD